MAGWINKCVRDYKVGLYKYSSGNVKVQLELSYYTLKPNLKGATGTDKFTLVSKTDLVGLKSKVDNVDVDKLKPVAADLSKLSMQWIITFSKKLCMIQTSRVLRRRLRMLTKRYPTPVSWSKRLIITLKVHLLKTRYLVFLD